MNFELDDEKDHRHFKLHTTELSVVFIIFGIILYIIFKPCLQEIDKIEL
jgi:hypothetical protein